MKIPLAVIAARSRFESTEAALEAHIKTHQAFFEQYEELVVVRNDALKAYKAAVSDRADALGTKYGSWSIAIPRKLDADALIDALGEEKAEELLNIKCTVDSKAYDAAVANNEIPKKVQKKVEGEDTPRLTGPKPIGLHVK